MTKRDQEKMVKRKNEIKKQEMDKREMMKIGKKGKNGERKKKR